MIKPIEIRKSRVHGRGMFLLAPAKKDELVSRISGATKILKVQSISDSLNYPNWIGLSKNQWIDPQPPHNFLNHSCDPNCGVKDLKLYALRNVAPRQELFVDYSTLEGDPFWSMKCRCGSNKCRKIIRSVQHLPREAFRRYQPYIPHYFRKLYREVPNRHLNQIDGFACDDGEARSALINELELSAH